MKYTAIISAILALSIGTESATTFHAAKRQEGAPGVSDVCTSSETPSRRQVRHAIKQWRNDVVGVNTFLNNFDHFDDLQSAAASTHGVAADEPSRLGVLACISGLIDAAQAVITNAAENFDTKVLDSLKTIAETDVPSG